MNISRLPAAEQDSVCCDAIVRDTAGARADLLTAGVRPLAALNGITVTGGTLDIGALMNVPANAPPAPNALANVPASIGAGGRLPTARPPRTKSA